jgi:hypothetical protein
MTASLAHSTVMQYFADLDVSMEETQEGHQEGGPRRRPQTYPTPLSAHASGGKKDAF